MTRRILFLAPIILALIALPAARSDDNKAPEGFEALFNGKDLTGWKVLPGGKMEVWGAENGLLYVNGRGGAWLMTDKEYSDFEVRLDFKMPKGGNSGVALRSPFDKIDPAYAGMEIQLLDDANYKNLRPTQYTGSIYDVVAPSKQVTKPFGEWQSIQITAKGPKITVVLNGTKTIDANLDDYKAEHGKKHPGILRDKGHLGLQSHDGRVEFKNRSRSPTRPRTSTWFASPMTTRCRPSPMSLWAARWARLTSGQTASWT
jgi:hypothetical protein